jgi:L-ribulokinase
LKRKTGDMMSNKDYVIGVDYGTDSVRSLLVDAHTGEEIASEVYFYSRYKTGKYCIPDQNQFRHHPLDYLEGLEKTVVGCLEKTPASIRNNVKGISIDSTGSTPGPVDKEGTLLALLPEFQDNPNAMFILWKDHTAVKEAAEINNVARTWGGTDFTKYVGGIYSAEWFWAKILHTIRIDETISEEAYSWVELCDWVPAVLTGVKKASEIKRGRCAAGHKAMWHQSWGGLPDEKFLIKIDPLLKGLKTRLYKNTYTSDISVGKLTPEWQKRFGLKGDVTVGIGAFDAHMGAVGAGVEPYALVKIIGTSTCDVLVAPKIDIGDKLIKGICGQVDGSVIPGMIGLEAGQSGFGDIYAWFRSLLYWPVQAIFSREKSINARTKEKLSNDIYDKIIPALTDEAKKLPIDDSSIIALDWLNGRRTPDANQLLKGAITGLNLGSDAPRVFRALVEATAFGARAVNDRFEAEGVPIKQIIATGGISKKSDYIMQTIADVLGRPIKVCESEQVCALGAAMCAAAASGIYKTIEEAQQHMNSGYAKEYKPNKKNSVKYSALYKRYRELGAYIESKT